MGCSSRVARRWSNGGAIFWHGFRVECIEPSQHGLDAWLDDAPRANDPRQPAKRRQRARTQRAVAMPFPAQGQRFAKRTRERASQPSEVVDMRTSGLSPY